MNGSEFDIHFSSELDGRADHQHSGRVGRRAAEHLGDLRITEAEFDTGNDSLALIIAQARERRFIPLERLFSDRRFQR